MDITSRQTGGTRVEVAQEEDGTTVGVRTDVVVDKHTGLVVEKKTIVAEVPIEGGGTTLIAEEQMQAVGLTDPPPSYGQSTDGQGALPYKKTIGMGKMRDQVIEAQKTSSTKDTLTVKLCKIFWRSGAPPYRKRFRLGRMRDQVREAQSTSPDKCTFAFRLCKIFCRSAACPVCMLSFAILPIVMIVIGALYFNDCPGISNLQSWLVVFGSFSLFDTVINIAWWCVFCNRDEDDCCKSIGTLICGILDGLVNTFLFAWMFVGSIWVYKHYNTWTINEMCRDPNNPDPSCYCHPVPYLFSFITVTTIYSISGLFFLCGCLYCSVVCIVTSVSEQ